MSRIFISVLGTGLYTETTYYNPVQNKISPPGKFVQVAMLHQLDIIDQWTDDDRILILLTKEARTLNWTPTDNRRSNRTGDTVEYRGLKQEMENLNLKCRIIDIDIPNGMAADEMWNIFNTLYENIDYNDQLYFDLTHGFRYLPMMALVFSHYSKYLKNTAIKSISYGNFEARNSIGAPIVDLLPLLDLQEWTLAASEFTDNANTAKIKELTSNNLSPLIRQYKGTNEA